MCIWRLLLGFGFFRAARPYPEDYQYWFPDISNSVYEPDGLEGLLPFFALGIAASVLLFSIRMLRRVSSHGR